MSPSIADGGSHVAPTATSARATPPAPEPPPPPVKVYVRSKPRAYVSWGRKQLGLTPLTVERPRDSGPMDLIIRAKGYLPFHVRAFTFHNDSIFVDLTKPEESEKLLGARKAPPPDAAPPPASPPPAASPITQKSAAPH